MEINDPACEAAKAAQNQIYAAANIGCETRKAADRIQFENSKAICYRVALACSTVRNTTGSSRISGARILWVGNSDGLFERQALTELGAKIVLADNAQEAMKQIRIQTEKVGTIISAFQQSENDPQSGDTLLTGVLKLPHPPPYIIYFNSSNAAIALKAKAKGAFGATDQVKELFELLTKSINRKQ